MKSIGLTASVLMGLGHILPLSPALPSPCCSPDLKGVRPAGANCFSFRELQEKGGLCLLPPTLLRSGKESWPVWGDLYPIFIFLVAVGATGGNGVVLFQQHPSFLKSLL